MILLGRIWDILWEISDSRSNQRNSDFQIPRILAKNRKRKILGIQPIILY